MVQPDDPWTDEDRRNQRMVNNLNQAQFSYTNKHGEDATNTLSGGAAWARTHLQALNSSMPPVDLEGVQSYHVTHPDAAHGYPRATGVYFPKKAHMELRMAFPETHPDRNIQAMRDAKFRHVLTHEHGHHVDNMMHGNPLADPHASTGELEARAETYADRYSNVENGSTYDAIAARGEHSAFGGERGTSDYRRVRAARDLPTNPRRVRDATGDLQRPSPRIMPRRAS